MPIDTPRLSPPLEADTAIYPDILSITRVTPEPVAFEKTMPLDVTLAENGFLAGLSWSFIRSGDCIPSGDAEVPLPDKGAVVDTEVSPADDWIVASGNLMPPEVSSS